MAEIGNVTVRVDAVITDEQYHEAMSAVSAANEYIAALEADNAKLREELEVVGTAAYLYGRDDLKAENAKLWELVLDMWFWCYEGHMDNKSQEWQMKHIDGVLDRMHELGVRLTDG